MWDDCLPKCSEKVIGTEVELKNGKEGRMNLSFSFEKLNFKEG